MAGDLSGEDTFVPLPRRSDPPARGRGTIRHRIGPLRTVAEAADHPVLSGIRSGAVSGLIIVAVLGLPVLLILGAKAPPPAALEPPARVRAADADAPVRAWAEPVPDTVPRAIPAPIRSPAPALDSTRGRVAAAHSPLGIGLIPVLDDESGVLSLEPPPLPVARPARPNRPPAQRAARTP